MIVFTWIGWMMCFVTMLFLSALFFGGTLVMLFDWFKDKSSWRWLVAGACASAVLVYLWNLMFTYMP